MLSAENLFIFLAILVSVLFFGLGFKDIAEFILLLAVVVFAFWTAASKKATMSELNAMMAQAFLHELAVQTYTEKRGDLGKLLVVIKSQSAHLAKVIARIDNTAAQVARESEHGVKLSGYKAKLIQNQQAETLHVATKINEMTITIAQVSKHVADTATDADSAAKLTERGNLVSQQTHQAIIKLQQTVQAMWGVVKRVAAQTKKIVHAAQIIEQLSEQTNLLALNAAIDAARAGEKGRGFAFIADEVCNLVQRTQQSTKDIYLIVGELTQWATVAMEVATFVSNDADAGLAKSY